MREHLPGMILITAIVYGNTYSRIVTLIFQSYEKKQIGCVFL